MFRLISFGGGSSVPFGDVGAEVDQRRTVFGIGIVGEHLHGAGVGLLMVAVGVQQNGLAQLVADGVRIR